MGFFLFLFLSSFSLRSDFTHDVSSYEAYLANKQLMRSDLAKFQDRYGFDQQDQVFAQALVDVDYAKKIKKTIVLPKRGAVYVPLFSVEQNNQDKNRYVKAPDVFRVVNARRMASVIKYHKFCYLAVARKAIGRLPSVEQDVVLAQPVCGEAVTDVSLEEIKELAEFVKITGFTDFGGFNVKICEQHFPALRLRNLIRDLKTKKLTFIDTENISFGGEDPPVEWACSGTVHPCSQLSTLLRMYDHLYAFINDESREWLEQEIEQMIKRQEGFECRIPLPNNSKYDDDDIDFAQAAKEYPVRLSW